MLLYMPYASNPIAFDDHNIFDTLAVFDLAQTPFSSIPRVFPYFSIGFIHVLSGGDLLWNRCANVVLHGLVAIAIYCFMLRTIQCGDSKKKVVIASFVSCWFFLNPVAVYGVAYLTQRTILFATLFGVISTNLYLRGLAQCRNADLVSSAFLCVLSMMCKEHAVLFPFAAIVLTIFVTPWSKRVVLKACGFCLMSLPAVVWVVMKKGEAIVGVNYEEYSGQVLSQISSALVFDFPGGTWGMSFATQLLLFWKYLFYWFFPNIQWMSIDVRVDFTRLWSGIWPFVECVLSLFVFGVASILWVGFGRVSREVRLWSSALLFALVLFAAEFSVVRVQEPFVLYRSYLWMPAYALLMSMALTWCEAFLTQRGLVGLRRLFCGSAIIACACLFPLAQDRLASLSSEEALWRDALQKLSAPDIPGSDRIYYNLAGEAYKRKDLDEALRLSKKVVEQNPTAFQGYLAVGTSLLAKGDIDGARRAYDQALAHQPPEKFLGYIEFKRCYVMESRDWREEMIECWRRSARMGYEGAKYQLKMMGIAE